MKPDTAMASINQLEREQSTPGVWIPGPLLEDLRKQVSDLDDGIVRHETPTEALAYKNEMVRLHGLLRDANAQLLAISNLIKQEASKP